VKPSLKLGQLKRFPKPLKGGCKLAMPTSEEPEKFKRKTLLEKPRMNANKILLELKLPHTLTHRKTKQPY